MYQKMIKQVLDNRPYDPRHIEAYMRLEHPTLDGLPHNQFAEEVEIAIQCVEEDGILNAEMCARSFGL